MREWSDQEKQDGRAWREQKRREWAQSPAGRRALATTITGDLIVLAVMVALLGAVVIFAGPGEKQTAPAAKGSVTDVR